MASGGQGFERESLDEVGVFLHWKCERRRLLVTVEGLETARGSSPPCSVHGSWLLCLVTLYLVSLVTFTNTGTFE